jgi:hypothetical protein
MKLNATLKVLLFSSFIWIVNDASAENQMPTENDSGKSLLPTVSKMDSDHDGKVSRDEAFGFKFVSKYWDKIDQDRDGYLDAGELKKADTTIAQEEARLTDHPTAVEQYKNGEYISPEQQIEENSKD